MACFWVGRALDNHRKLKMSEKKKGIFLKDSLSFLAAVSHVTLPPPPCHRGFITVLMETCSTAGCSTAITKGFTWPSANPTRLWNNDRELVQRTSWFPFLVPFPALGPSQLGQKCALSNSQSAGWNLSFPSCLKTVNPGTSKINAGVGSFLKFWNCVSVTQIRRAVSSCPSI